MSLTLIKVKVANRILQNDYTNDAQIQRLKYSGQFGNIVKEHNSHGTCFDIQFKDGAIATYDPNELEIIGEI